MRQHAFDDFTDRCTLGHHGIVLDLGHPASDSLRVFQLVNEAPAQVVTREGESFRHLDQLSTEFIFWLTDELTELEVQARVHGLSSDTMSISIDGKRLGAARLERETTQTHTIHKRDLGLTPGRHRMSINLSRPRGSSPSADISWIRIGPAREEVLDTPATRRETFSEVTIDKTRLSSILLRPEASLRCPIWVPPETSFEAQFGIWGDGEGEVEVIVNTTRGERIVVASHERKAEDPRAFAPFKADLSAFAGQFIDIELSAPRSLKRTRLAIGEPSLKSTIPEVTHAPKAKRAIVVVLSGLSENHNPPLAAEHGLPVLNQLATDAATFSNYRASSTSTTSAIASIILGLPPWEHGVDGMNVSLPTHLVPLASIVEGQSGRSSFFTGVPLSFEPFGFSRGFEHFESVAPQEDRAATEPLALAKKWLSKSLDYNGPVLSLIHLRGGHPPFDVSQEAAMTLPPSEYGGHLSPRRAAMQLREIRARELARNQTMPSEDWERLEALQKAALLRQSAELGELISWLRQHDAYNDTLLIVVGDVGAGRRPVIPFSEEAKLDESYLSPPLLIKFPQGYAKGQRPSGFFAPHDLTLTILKSLGLNPAQASDSIDLGSSEAPRQALLRPHLAYREGEYSMRIGDVLLQGTDGSPPQVCLPALDPECNIDRSETAILESRALWLSAWHILAGPLNHQKKKLPIEVDPTHENALRVWGVRE